MLLEWNSTDASRILFISAFHWIWYLFVCEAHHRKNIVGKLDCWEFFFLLNTLVLIHFSANIKLLICRVTVKTSFLSQENTNPYFSETNVAQWHTMPPYTPYTRAGDTVRMKKSSSHRKLNTLATRSARGKMKHKLKYKHIHI